MGRPRTQCGVDVLASSIGPRNEQPLVGLADPENDRSVFSYHRSLLYFPDPGASFGGISLLRLISRSENPDAPNSRARGSMIGPLMALTLPRDYRANLGERPQSPVWSKRKVCGLREVAPAIGLVWR
ncbi:hypothetical protein ACVWYJ_000510 [Bradyrhizobium sp. USDA 4471]